MNKTLILFLSISALLLLGCSGPNDQQQVENARQFLHKGDLKSALIELKNSLQQNPENQQARVYLGQIYLQGSNFAATEKELKRAIELGADPNETHPYLAQALLQLRKLDEVLALQTDALSGPAKGELLASQGVAHLIRGQSRQASEFTQQALGLAPGSTYVHVARASVHMLADKSIVKARQELARAFEIDPDYAPAWSLLGDIEAAEKEPEKALEAYDRALTLKPANLTDRNKRVTINILLDNLKKAQYDLDILKNQLPNNPGIHFSQGLVFLAQNRLEDAKSAFDLALLARERYPLSLYYTALVNYLQGNLAQAETQAEQFHTGQPDHLPGRKLLADIKFSRGEYPTVIELLAPVFRESESDDGILNILAKTYLKQGKTAEGIALLRQLVERNPESSEARVRLGAGLLSGGMEREGFAELEKAISSDEESHEAEVYRVLSFIRLKRLEEALAAAHEFRQRAPQSEIPYNLIGMVHIAAKDLDKARESLLKSWQINPGNTDAGLNLATIAIHNGALSDARMYLETVSGKHPENLEALLKLAQLNQREGKTEQFVRNLEEAIRRHPAALKPRVILASYFISTGKPAQVTGLIEVLDLEARKTPQVLELLTYQGLAQGRFVEAGKHAQQLLEQAPDSPLGYYLMARASVGQDKLEMARKQLDQALQKNSRFIPARLERLKLLVREQEIEALEQEVAEIKTLAPENQEVMRIEFALEQLKGDQGRALVLAEKLFEAYPTLENMLALTRQHERAGSSDVGQQLRREWADKHPDDLRSNIMVAETFTRSGQPQVAARYYQRALELSPDNLVALNNLAWSLRESDPQQALEHARRANELKPGSIVLMDTLALAYLASGDHDMALRTIKEVNFLEPENPAIRYHEAMIRVASGNREEAVRILRSLLASDQTFAERAEADALLKSLQ